MKTNIQFYSEATLITKTQDCLLFLAISGTKEGIREKLQSMIAEIDSNYSKPCQGCVSSFGKISHVITPVWGGKEY